MRFFLSLAILAACFLPATGMSAPLSAFFGAPTIIDIASLKPFLDTLPPDEKAEQLRDWALYGVRGILALTSTGEMPIRHPALKNTLPGEVSPGRVFPINSSEWGVIVAPEQMGDKPLLGGIIDKKYAASNHLPETISLFTYANDPSLATITIAFAGSIKSKDLFTPEYGYHSATVSTLAEFNNFAANIDDVVSFQWRAGSVIIGGRKYAKDARRALTVEDIAGLYQAFNAPVTPPATEVDIGFSLDHRLNHSAFGEDLKEIEKVPGVEIASADPAFAALLSRHHSDFVSIGDRLKKQHDIRPFKALQRRYQEAQMPAEARLRSLLRFIEERNSYQAARYDGKLQGTSVAMILFYTDLLAKLWLLDHDGIAPSSVVGFRNMREIKVPKLYWDDYLRLPATRLWFGLREEGFEFYGNKILFQPVVTRVYAASFDPLFPGQESKPNYQNREFLGWWDTHFEAMADADPYYHKLDQIQKWSCIFMVLQEYNSHLLDFLMGVSVRHNIDFENWNKREVRDSKIRIPFLDKRQYGSATECLPLLSSNTFPLMGRTYMINGGVSLASRKNILAKMRQHDAQQNSPRSLLSENHLVGAGSATQTGKLPPRYSVPKTKANADQLAQGFSPRKRPESAATQPTKPPGHGPTPVVDAEPRIAPNRDYGTFSTEKTPGALKLTWTKGPALAPHELVSSLVSWQEANKDGLEGEGIFGTVANIQSVVRVKERNIYLVRTAVSKDEWIYLAVNPEKTAEYPAKGAADFREADIFCAKLISAENARKLSTGKPVVR